MPRRDRHHWSDVGWVPVARSVSVAQAERLLRAAAPDDFGGVPIYLAERHELSEYFDIGGAGRLGCTCSLMDLMIRPYLPRGQWRGRGFGAAVWSARIRELVGGTAERDAKIQGTVLHEAAHFLTFAAAADAPAADDAPAVNVPAANATAANAPAVVEHFSDAMIGRLFAESAVDVDGSPWAGHGPDWIRAALHLYFRARRVGWPGRLADIGPAGSTYRLSPAEDYLIALGAELVERVAEPIRSILASPKPRELVELFQHDTGETCP